MKQETQRALKVKLFPIPTNPSPNSKSGGKRQHPPPPYEKPPYLVTIVVNDLTSCSLLILVQPSEKHTLSCARDAVVACVLVLSVCSVYTGERQ
jgi:hypothetical protein